MVDCRCRPLLLRPRLPWPVLGPGLQLQPHDPGRALLFASRGQHWLPLADVPVLLLLLLLLLSLLCVSWPTRVERTSSRNGLERCPRRTTADTEREAVHVDETVVPLG